MYQANQSLTSHPQHVSDMKGALRNLLIVNVVFYAISNLLQAEIVFTSQDMILLLLGYLAVEMQSVNALKLYIDLSIISVGIDFLSLLSIFFLVSSLNITRIIDVIFILLFVVENYFKYRAITYSRKIKDDWKEVQLPSGAV
eukprot:NODE_13_length_42895_cov_0.518413.p21 type:complete len:142 gc:universal NODE_13_length_42895_cov_0.518413:37754-37329(-)